MLKLTLLIVFVITSCVIATENEIVSARVESCKGCSLNRLPEVKAFIYEDLPNYQNIIFKPIPGAPPELVLLNKADEEIQRISLKDLDRKACNDLLVSKGFNKNVDREF